MNLFETVSLLLSAALLGGYYLWLTIEVRRYPLRTVVGYSAVKRREWVQSVMSERRDVPAVPLALWLFGALWLLFGSALLSIGLYHMDKLD